MVSPSSVVEALCGAEGIDYIGLMIEVIGELTAATGLSAVLIAHLLDPVSDPAE